MKNISNICSEENKNANALDYENDNSISIIPPHMVKSNSEVKNKSRSKSSDDQHSHSDNSCKEFLNRSNEKMRSMSIGNS